MSLWEHYFRKEDDPMEKHILIWEGITIEVSYDPDWLNMKGPHKTAHLELRVLEPKSAMIPVTETGYRSAFIAQGVVEEGGGPEKFTKDWLDYEATKPEWKNRHGDSNQLSLF